MIKNIKKKIKYKVIYLIGDRYNHKFSRYKKAKKIYYLATPSHGNMGDQAIAEASVQFFYDKFPEYTVIEVYREDVNKYAKAIKKSLNKDDLIFIHGGGNMGNLYIWEEQTRRQIIKLFKNNPIISMTQTITFTSDEFGKKELEKSKKIYNNHLNLSLIAREKKSYDKMSEEFGGSNVLINPDIVLYLFNRFKFEKEKRVRIMSCLRRDKESILGNQKDEIIEYLKKKYQNYFEYDTVIKQSVHVEKRSEKLNAMFNEFKKSQVVITDRLHGMVFCAITKTPCIVTKSLDHKVTGTYEWIKDLNYIRLVDNLNIEAVDILIQELLQLEELTTIDLDKNYFNTIRERLGM
ncbi:polysaccharide pyruvyl transferase family protein [Turicibacter sanguinis]|uniref:polysaccharide pyruvyl transferase family protein n=1 Tax=Turicibacter sanguinis TaxID=154288 RepID=UPI0018A93FC0|nr:polysaccharide pyruvyl transferase family protein [Turicibacter sanguinis]MDB8551640.1 polysaccharide pyruvyl transferase family protein [Turicibacter sanguinis]